MYDHWSSDLERIWLERFELPASRVKGLTTCFSDWFKKRGFHNHDDIYIEYSSKTQHTSVSFNHQVLDKVCDDEYFGRGMMVEDFFKDKDNLVDLLPTLWTTQYDHDNN